MIAIAESILKSADRLVRFAKYYKTLQAAEHRAGARRLLRWELWLLTKRVLRAWWQLLRDENGGEGGG